MSDQYKFGLKVTGEGLFPEALRPRAIAELLISVDIIIDTNLEANALPKSKYTADFEVNAISRGSLNCEFITKNQAVKQAWCTVTGAIKRQEFDALTNKTRNAVQKIIQLNRHHQTQTEFWHDRAKDGYESLAFLSSANIIARPQRVIQIAETLHGELLRIGGENKPTASIRFLEGFTIPSCPIVSMELASKIAQRLYEIIGVRGISTRVSSDLSLINFKVLELTDYRQAPLLEAFDSLKDVAGKYYEQIPNIDSFIDELRGRDDD